jgi:hypothetical protein
LQHPQEFALQVEWDFTNFVKEKRTTVGSFEPSGPIFYRTTESPLQARTPALYLTAGRTMSPQMTRA